MNEDPDANIAISTLTLEPNDQHRLAALCGSDDENLRQIERRLQVQVRNRSNTFQITGSERQVDKGDSVIQRLYEETETNKALDPQTVHLFLQEVCSSENENTNEPEVAADAVIITRKKHVKPRSPNQRKFVHNLRHCDVNFGIGPAGTGKTYLAVACAVEALDRGKVNRIILVRPAVEVGEKLGFLPGDLAQKIDPYLRPLYDALYEMLGTQRVQKHIERHEIEVVPLAYMRGRTLNSAFIILDEGQNTTIAQMKMFLTRIGFGSTVAITGDVTQIDLPQSSSQRSGLTHVLRITKDIEDISVVRFHRRDVVRHPVVQHIVDAYERDDIERKKTNGKRQRGSL